MTQLPSEADASKELNFREYFNLARFPYVTVAVMTAMIGVYAWWQGGAASTPAELARLGAKSPALMSELGQWWRLLTANFLHVSAWHLAINVFFLFNLGGPTEAVFRRLDYVLILVASGVGTFLMSAAVNHNVSCGASGMVFGVWGAAAVFGMRHRDILPDRYRRYFIGGVIPYSIVALYLGFAMPGVDNWGHLGGLLGGSFASLLLPARLLEPVDDNVPAKLAALAGVAFVLALGSALPRGVGELSAERYYSALGLEVPVPVGWRALVHKRTPDAERFAFTNGADVSVTLQIERTDAPTSAEEAMRDFVTNELDADSPGGTRATEVSPVNDTTRLGLRGKHVRTVIATPTLALATNHYVLVRGRYRCIVSTSAPPWLNDAYEPFFDAMLAGGNLADREIRSAASGASEQTP